MCPRAHARLDRVPGLRGARLRARQRYDQRDFARRLRDDVQARPSSGSRPARRAVEAAQAEAAARSPPPLRRPGGVRALCAFLASAQAGFITGQNILIDGGAFLACSEARLLSILATAQERRSPRTKLELIFRRIRSIFRTHYRILARDRNPGDSIWALKARTRESAGSRRCGALEQLGLAVLRLRRSYGSRWRTLAPVGRGQVDHLQIERNETNPTLTTIWRLARALDVSIQSMLEGGEDGPFIEHLNRGATPIFESDDACAVSP